MTKRLTILFIALATATPCLALTFKNIHAKYLIIGNAVTPPVVNGADIGGFGGETIGGFGGENIGGLP